MAKVDAYFGIPIHKSHHQYLRFHYQERCYQFQSQCLPFGLSVAPWVFTKTLKPALALLQDWSQLKGYANPPWSLIGRVLSKVQMDKAHIVLVTPVWKTQPWYPLLLQMLVARPHLINHHQTMLNRGPEDLVPQLAVWHISGRDTDTKSFKGGSHFPHAQVMEN